MEQFKGQPRLPKFAIPKRYDIRLKPDLSACKFAGFVSVELDIVADTRFIVLNAAELSINLGSVSFSSDNSPKVFEALKLELVEEDEILVLDFAETLPLGLGVLAIGFEGVLNDKMKGFYRSKYELHGEKKNMAVTQFEPADARRCFPCWDEPACKATFKITLDVPSELLALSNMPVIEEKVNGPLKTVSYQESPIMSTYLVAIVVGLFDYVEDYTSDGIKVRVYCQVGKANQGKFALSVAVRTLDLYKDYFAVPYSLPKLDMVAIPDFAAGAMENYGLVTYRETTLLYDEQHSAATNKQRVATVVAHELAHQWFGNLVTMEWWTHLWLNEGFATWVSYLATDSLFPEWKIWTQFLDESTDSLRLDGLAESHPIEVEINHAAEIDEIFDAISYKKGASVIRMLQSYLGAECFQITYKVGRIAADARPELMDDINLFFVNLFQYTAEKLGWDAKQGESHLDAMLRGEILTALAMLGHEETLAEASRRFHAFLNDRNTPILPPDIRKAAYVAVMQKVNSSNRAGLESLLRVYRETDLSQEKTRILGSLASCPDQGIVLEVLNFALSSEVRSQDAVFGLAVSKEGREVAWTWLKDNWDLIVKTYGSGFLITCFVSAIVSPFASFEKAKEVEEFFASRAKASIARTLKQSLERVRINANWIQSIEKEKNLGEAVQELAYRKH
ncbi:aminopeptidase M1-like isoform X2 [Durio zibethinus]|uniref:membrane alanyl aminopeptidase n=1 Tax=Durio zibethinus TaxID=66656 RepID=A0A6P5XWA3_DURZI|nr:aminopeptidase M1-like isoform X2 [Durio zibethinus]